MNNIDDYLILAWFLIVGGMVFFFRIHLPLHDARELKRIRAQRNAPTPAARPFPPTAEEGDRFTFLTRRMVPLNVAIVRKNPDGTWPDRPDFPGEVWWVE